jgi:hypothetical protein
VLYLLADGPSAPADVADELARLLEVVRDRRTALATATPEENRIQTAFRRE